MQALDLSDPPLTGTQLIEASAGTGKTYALAALYLHLLLKGLRVEQILVMTFTKAATAELHARIRARLHLALQAFVTGNAAEPLLQTLLQRYPDHAKMRWNLRYALRSFEQAAIYTIHGFCHRVLQDFPLTTGHSPGLTLRENEAAVQQAVAEDFWRREITTAHPVLAAYLLQECWTPESMLAQLPGKLQAYEHVQTVQTPPPLAPLWDALGVEHAKAQTLWLDMPPKAALLNASAGLNQKSYKPVQLEKAFQALDTALAGETPPPTPPEAYAILGLTKLRSSCTQKASQALLDLLGHPLWALLDTLSAHYKALAAALETHRWGLFARLRAYCLEELPVQGQRQQVFSYDDLPRTLSAALTGPHAARLLPPLRARYPAALVDEFQDTDGEQLQILTALYARPAETTGASVLYLVGDPKQAIYRFRGADIYSYLKARRLASAQHHLQENYRATPGLLKGLNTLYSLHLDPFLQPEISYHPVQPGHPAAHYATLQCGGETLTPWQLGWLLRASDCKALTKGVARPQALAWLAAEVTRLLTQGHVVTETQRQTVLGSDIAVLVRTHHQADEVRAALAQCGIASAQLGAASVFSSREAEALGQLLSALADPAQESVVKGALVGPFYALTAAELLALEADDTAWEQRLEAFWDDHALWRQQGFMAMFRAWLWREKIAAHLLSQPEGERQLTNVLHLAELLHQEAQQENLGLHALLRWFQQQRQAVQTRSRTGEEAHELRLESDAHRVRILTLHKSKGLEFNIVFCPLLWDESKPNDASGERAYHTAAPDYTRVLDLTGGTLPASAQAESQAESARLVYVALTRAKLCCYLSFGVLKEPETALGRLLQSWLGVQALEELPNYDDATLLQGLRAQAAAVAPGSWTLTPIAPETAVLANTTLPAPMPPEPLTALDWNRKLHPGWWVTSFSALLDTEHTEGMASEYPSRDASPAGPPDWQDIHQFPRGRFTGRCWHGLLQWLDFRRAPPDYRRAQVVHALVTAGFAPEWQPALMTMLTCLLDMPRPALGGACLSQLGPEDVLRELEFHFSGQRLNAEPLSRLLAQHGYSELALRAYSEAPWGVVHGFIDLVIEHQERYYLGDYKSNWLGPDASAYASAKLEPVLHAEGYTLQALIYTLALHRYLRLRLPGYAYDRHYGGMGFFFLRGLSSTDPTQGVLVLRPDLAVIEALDAYFSPA